MKPLQTLFIISVLLINQSFAQNIGDFTSVMPTGQTTDLVLPSSHRFHYIIEHQDPIDSGGVTMTDDLDFTAYVPIGGSSTQGYLSINSERFPGFVHVLDIEYDPLIKKWNRSFAQRVDFSPVGGTGANCSGAVTPWGTVISCEETIVAADANNDGYRDIGWAVEIDPVSKTVIDKLWALGNFKHENAVVHSNERTVYQGADDNPGYLFKFVADSTQDLSSGSLYTYVGSKSGSGNWVLINNTTKGERDSTNDQCAAIGATVFNGIEDVEIGPDGKIYVAVKGECRVYRFDDSDPFTGTTVSNFETFVGNASYSIDFGDGIINEPWGCGNDNLAFDGDGNLWVLQDGGKDFIWVVGATHTQATPDVRVFATTPSGCEPTGITFTPDYKYLFMSIMHPSSGNIASSQSDAFGNLVSFNKDVAIVIARKENLGPPCLPVETPCDDGDPDTNNDVEDGNCNCNGIPTGKFTVTSAINNGNDDVEENGNTGSINFTSSDLELVNDAGTSAGNQTVGMRFNNIKVPTGKIITNAFIQFTTDEADNGVTNLTIQAQDTGHAPVFAAVTNNVSSRNTTSASVVWNPFAWDVIGEKGPSQKTSNLKTVIQEVVDRPDWVSGNSMVLIVTGTGERTAESYNGSPAQAAELLIRYDDSCSYDTPVAYTNTITTTSAKLNWTQTQDNSGYTITGGQLGGGTVTLSVAPGNNSLQVNSLKPNTTYVWRLQAKCGSKPSSQYSNIDTFTTASTCAAPDSVYVSNISNTKARLNWTSTSGVNGYRIFGNKLGLTPDVKLSVIGESNTFYNVSGLTSGTAYSWQVHSICTDASISLPTKRDTFTTSSASNKIAASLDFSIYPNPVTDGKINIQFNEKPSEKVSITIYDLLGRKILSEVHPPQQRLSIDCSSCGVSPFVVVIVEGDRSYHVILR
ncbi:MAG: DUF839 domain-containing protein [Bacteroidia bacterium]|nr:DUF839 domain-containing protein [Bacteroidia bacterium]